MRVAGLTDIELVENVQKNIETNFCLNELINRHSGAYFSIVQKYFPESKAKYLSVNVDKDFVYDSKEYIIYNSAISFRKDKNTKFSTHVCNQARYFCLNQINKTKPLSSFEENEMENLPAEESENNNKIDNVISSKIIEIIKQIPDERVYEIFKLRYLEAEGKKVVPWSKIYKKISHARSRDKHLTIQGCINLHNKALKEIRKKIKSFGNI